jgi:hypothetical protein
VRNAAFGKLIDEIKALHDSKNHDYAEDADPLSNLRRAEKVGVDAWRGVLVRLTDKWSRIEQLTTGKSPKHESLRDSLVDNAVYSLLAVLLLDEQQSSSAHNAEPRAFYTPVGVTYPDGLGGAAKVSTTIRQCAQTAGMGSE